MLVVHLLSIDTAKRTTQLVKLVHPILPKEMSEFEVGPALFGPNLGTDVANVTGELYVLPGRTEGDLMGNGCQAFSEEHAAKSVGKVVMVIRGGCLFVQKVRVLNFVVRQHDSWCAHSGIFCG